MTESAKADTNVVAMPGFAVPRVQGEPIPELVEICEELLELAQSGKLRGLAAAQVHADPMVLATTSMFSEAGVGRYFLIAAVSMLDHDIKAAAFDD